ncbi:MAG: malto-oligosyltrehalose trehalohydrolase [Steroidobacteraceae bacterium]
MGETRRVRVPGVRLGPEGARFQVWAPRARTLEVAREGAADGVHELTAAEEGYFVGLVPGLKAGDRYKLRIDGGEGFPDPCSRYQPDGPHGASELVDTSAFAWTDQAWTGIRLPGQVIYEVHIGTFTCAGTFDAAITELAELKAFGITLLEVMPIAEFPGQFNWGYDGVQLFAPYHGYGEPQSFMRFVDAAHGLGLGVMLDVVYNHLGPDGNYLTKFSDTWFTDRYSNDWGESINFDGPGSAGVRAHFLDNARYWVEEFHLDGLRLDATQSIQDSGSPHMLREIVEAARAAAVGRDIIITSENEPQKASHLLPANEGGHGLDAMWNDDFHHTARVAATGAREGYFTDYRGSAQEFIATARRGFLYQGQHYSWQKQPRGEPVTSQPAAAFVAFIQNHDQVANTFFGQRLEQITSPGRRRALTALLLLGPQTPLLFMGEEFAASTPFPFFADHISQLRVKVYEGRREFLRQFPSYATAEAQAAILDPGAESTFIAAKLKFSERISNGHTYEMYRELLRLRREDCAIAAQDRFAIDGAVLGEHCFILRWAAARAADERLLFVNLGTQVELPSVPEPLLAPPAGRTWRALWSSDEPRYGGGGVRPVHDGARWIGQPEQATLLWPA